MLRAENYWGPLAYIEKHQLDIRGVIHVGAHFAGEVEHYVAHDVSNIVFFEPLSECYSVLLENIKKYNINIKTHQIALGNLNGFIDINVSTNNKASSSVLNPKEHFHLHPEVEFLQKERVRIQRLDDFGYQQYNLLVIDVQGYELEVLKGAEKTLNHIDYLYCEVNRGEVYENNCMINDLDEFLSKFNFSRVETEWWCGNGMWGDALYLRDFCNK